MKEESMPPPAAADSLPAERQLPRVVLIALLLAIAILLIHLSERRMAEASHAQTAVPAAAYE